MTTSQLPYRERLAAPTWAAPAFLTLSGVVLARRLRAAARRQGRIRRVVAIVGSLFTTLAVLRMVRRFSQLAIEVDSDAVHVRFGPIEKQLPMGEIRDVRIVTYNPLRYLGWGYRIGIGGGQAFSQIGVARGVELTLQEGEKTQRYFISSRTPEALANAIATAAGAGGAA